ncbi:hypothetical protein ACGFZZ_00705 [Streptomyces tendae]|uniref:hypothetical protein n=1 Tax=Streptomyces tendae TaxID=1932 RepID=UPI0033F3E5BC
MPRHGTHVVRRARLYADGPNFVVRDARCQERRYAVAVDGIRRAVFFPPQDVWEIVQNRPADRWGVLVFKDDSGRDLLHVPLAGWLPEAESIGTLDLRPYKCLDRTGLRQLVETLGIPWEESREPLTASGVPDDGRGSTPHRTVHAEFPRRRGCVKGLAIFGWFIALVIGIAADLTWAMPVAAGALFLLPAGDTVVRVRAWWRNSQHGRLVKSTEIRPSPAAGSGGTRRFLRTASLRVLPHDVVLTNTLGEERWLGRAGTFGAARLVRLVDPTTGEPLGVEVRDREGEARALLPWRFWFAGPQGSEGWTALVGALGVPISDEKYRQPKDAQLWWRDHALATDARKMSPMKAKDARKQSGWHNSVAGTEELLTLPFFSALLLVGLFSDEAPMILAGWLSALTLALVLGPAAVSVLVSRLSFDRVLEVE